MGKFSVNENVKTTSLPASFPATSNAAFSRVAFFSAVFLYDVLFRSVDFTFVACPLNRRASYGLPLCEGVTSIILYTWLAGVAGRYSEPSLGGVTGKDAAFLGGVTGLLATP